MAQVRVGVFGKLPARGDFVREGLPRDFTDPWDEWWQRGIAATQAQVGEVWVESWLDAPVWRFALPPGLCGREGVLGVWMPSVDKVGRYFPLTVAAIAPFDWADSLAGMENFLAAAEEAGRDALEFDKAPSQVVLQAEAGLATSGEPAGGGGSPSGDVAWWTLGGSRVAARAETGRHLPEGPAFAGLIDDGWAAAPHPPVMDSAGSVESVQ